MSKRDETCDWRNFFSVCAVHYLLAVGHQSPNIGLYRISLFPFQGFQMDAVSFRSLYTIALEYTKSGCPIKKRNVQTTLLDGEIQLIPHGPSRVRC